MDEIGKSIMKKPTITVFLVMVVLLPSIMAQVTLSHAQNAAPKRAVYNSFWFLLTESEVKATIQRNQNNGVELEPLMMRAILQKKTRWYLKVIKAASDDNPQNATLRAAYGWALAKSHFSYTMQGGSQPKDIAEQYPLDNQSIRDILQGARDIDSKSWMAYMGEAALPLGASAGQPTKSAALTKQAFNIQSNAVTLSHYGYEQIWQGTLMKDIKQKRAGLRLLELACRRYPNYYKNDLNLYFAYRKLDIADKTKSEAAKQRFLNSIPPESRRQSWVQEYLKYLGIS
jgi:hypothetical protein